MALFSVSKGAPPRLSTDKVPGEMDIEQFRAKFRVKIVIDPWNNELSLAEAVQNGVVDITRNQYLNKVAGNKMSIMEAIQRGLIIQLTPMERIMELRQVAAARGARRRNSSFTPSVRTVDDTCGRPNEAVSASSESKNGDVAESVETTQKRGLQRSYSLRDSNCTRRPKQQTNTSVVGCFYGLISFRTRIKAVKYTITSVVDTRSDEWWPFERAKGRGIINVEEQTYIDSRRNQALSFEEAIDNGLITIETSEENFTGEEREDDYVVYGVMDLLEQRRITFREAIETCVLVREPPIYRDTLNHMDLSLDEAIAKHFVVAKFIDGNSLALYDRMISEENRLEADREARVMRYEQK